jgi:hypothetical protein
MFMERDMQMRLLDSLLFKPKNLKERRNLLVAVAASGMGKSAFVDEYSWRLLNMAKLSCIHPIAITFNIKDFGGSLQGDTVVDLAARLLMSYFVLNPSIDLLAKIFGKLSEISIKPENAYAVLRATVESIKNDLRIQTAAKKLKILIVCDEVGKSKEEKFVVQHLCTLIDGDDDLECFFTGLTLNPFSKESASGRIIKYVPLPLLSFAISLRLVQSFVTEPESLIVASKLARLSGGHPRTIGAFQTIVTSSPMRAVPWTDANNFQAVMDSTVFGFFPSTIGT